MIVIGKENMSKKARMSLLVFIVVVPIIYQLMSRTVPLWTIPIYLILAFIFWRVINYKK